MDIFPAINISHMGIGGIYANHEVIFIDLQGDYRHDEMQCVIAGENVFSCGFTSVIKWAG